MMKKWAFILLLAISLWLFATNRVPILEKVVEFPEVSNTEQDHQTDELVSKNTRKQQITNNQIHEGNLLLVNREYPIDEDAIKSDVIRLVEHKELVKGYSLLDNSIRLSEDVARKFMKMIAAANRDGVNGFLINSGFRDLDEQKQLYKELGADYAMPAGYSEHNLGLSIDIGSSQTKMEQAPEGKWLKKNAWKYGFVMRYPQDKVEITGIQYEPWHFRYVGLPHSAIMQENNFVLEEYLDYLRENQTISTVIEGEEFRISYQSLSKKRDIELPENRDYDISGDNRGGVIITEYSK